MSTQNEFQQDSHVIYGLIGKCRIVGVETRTIEGQPVEFFRLEPLKNQIGQRKKGEPLILLPKKNARERGLRPLMDEATVNEVYRLLSEPEFEYELSLRWDLAKRQFEKDIQEGGAIALAKILGYMFVRKHQVVLPPTDLAKFFDIAFKALSREIAEVRDLSIAVVEQEMEKKLNQLRVKFDQ